MPTSSSKVCEKHFSSCNIIRKSEAFDKKTGKKYPRLVKDAVPTVFPGCPKYLSSYKTHRKDLNEKKSSRLENVALQRALVKSKKYQEIYEPEQKFSSFEELSEKIKSIPIPTVWSIIKNIEYILFSIITMELFNM